MDKSTDVSPNPPRHDELQGVGISSVRLGLLEAGKAAYASYGVWVDGYRRYQRISWGPTGLQPNELDTFTSLLGVDVYEAIVAAEEKRVNRFRA